MRPIRIETLAIASGLFFCLVSVSHAIVPQTDGDSQPFSDADLEFFETRVRPLLVDKCFECHGPEAKPLEGGLSLASRSAILTGGDTGPAIIPKDAGKSLLIDAINYGEVYEMPPDTKMSDDEIQILTDWVERGAPWPKESEVNVEREAFDLEQRKSSHWCWQVVKNPVPPEVSDSDWPLDPIDQFILHRLEAAGLSPAAPADRRTLIRRVYFDLIGLPPSPEQVEQFLNDDSPEAFEKVVDSLLESPAFGERWARHWMDLVRYAETYGHEFDYPIAHAYQYRDYLIRAFNEDVPYDQLIQEHLAGDLFTKPRLNRESGFNESILGTGFWFLGEATHAPVDVRNDEAGRIDNQIDVMSKSFLGLTVACARCHDHKFDAISAEDYYALAGFLQSSRREVAMLDPNQKIEKAHNRAEPLVRKGAALARQLVNRAGWSNQEQLAKYVQTAIEHLRNDSSWNQGGRIRFQGESLETDKVTGGKLQVQELQPIKDFRWDQNKQQFWIDPKPGDELVLGFELDQISEATIYDVVADFTKANDYGIFDVSINGNRLKNKLDLYASQISKTGPMQLGTIELRPGRQTIEFTVIGKHKRAAKRFMLGLDWIELQPVQQESPAELSRLATLKQLDPDMLVSLVETIKDSEQLVPGSLALSMIREASRSKTQVNRELIEKYRNQHQRAIDAWQRWESSTRLFESFDQGLPDDWFATGFACSQIRDPSLPFAASGQPITAAGAVHSGRFSANEFGVIRSPTFLLEHDQIHYRVRGRNVTVRLIIDGFFMDVHNALLFRGCQLSIPEAADFQWHTQAQDIQNHKGHRAHLEVIDHGGGYFELDEIRFSNGEKPTSKPAVAELAEVPGGPIDLTSYSAWVSNCLAKELQADATSGDRTLTSELATRGLLERLGHNPSVSVNEANPDADANPDARFVSTRAETDPDSGILSPAVLSVSDQLKELCRELDSINQHTPSPVLAIAMTDGTPEDEHVFIRGNHKTLGPVATRRFLSAISKRPINPEDSSGRLQLAQKITAPNNPLTSRVAVNRVWHHLMGQGIVASVDNFGVLGKPPTHPELLDHLARKFVADDWSVKRLIRRIVLSQTYRMASTPNPDAAAIDPDNQLLHRARIKRLQGEAIRDSILKISGELDSTLYGPSVAIHLTPFMSGRGRPGKSGPLNGDNRRSIYIEVRRNFLYPMMIAFDTPIPFNTIGNRNQSNVPAQALILMNDPFVIDQAQKWAARLVAEQTTLEHRVEQVYLHALGRPPESWELERAIEFLNSQADELNLNRAELMSHTAVWQDFCHVLFNVKEFIFIK